MAGETVKVWDPLVRIFHWALVLAFLVAYVTEDDQMWLHENAGYIVLGLVGFRVVWGFIGTRYARFSDFVVGPAMVLRYLKGLMDHSSPRYLGHNPAGGVMIVLLLIMLVLTSWSGIEALSGESLVHNSNGSQIISAAHANDEGEEHDDERERRGEGDEFWEDIHEGLANFTLFLVLVHIAGVIVSSRLHHENLVRAMISGRKRKQE